MLSARRPGGAPGNAEDSRGGYRDEVSFLFNTHVPRCPDSYCLLPRLALIRADEFCVTIGDVGRVLILKINDFVDDPHFQTAMNLPMCVNDLMEGRG